jgi:hypothetical protein
LSSLIDNGHAKIGNSKMDGGNISEIFGEATKLLTDIKSQRKILSKQSKLIKYYLCKKYSDLDVDSRMPGRLLTRLASFTISTPRHNIT